MTIKPLKDALKNLHSEHMKTEDLNGFFQDISVLIHEGLTEQYGLQQMESEVNAYTKYLQETKLQEQIRDLDEMVQRRMDNTGETKQEACNHIVKYLQGSFQ